MKMEQDLCEKKNRQKYRLLLSNLQLKHGPEVALFRL